MKLPEFFGGILVGSSIYVTVLATFFLGYIGGDVALKGQARLEILVPFVASAIAGLGIGFGIKQDDGGYGFSFSEISEYWPALIGGLALAIAVGSSIFLKVSSPPTPDSGIIFAILSIVLCVGGTILTVTSWEGSPY